VGAGNVALDVARILVRSAEDLARTDMPPDVLEALATSRIEDVHLLCRRGPEHTRFTTKELRELADLPDVDVIVDSSDLDAVNEDDIAPQARANVRVFADLATRPRRGRRRVHLHFWTRPIEIVGRSHVEALLVERTREVDGVVVGIGGNLRLDVGLVLRSVGYLSAPINGAPFDLQTGLVPHHAGRVHTTEGALVPGWYVTGWVKRGPSGVIGTNRACAADTVTALVADLHDRAPGGHTSQEADAYLESLGLHPVTFTGWLRIDAEERARGERAARDRTKVPDWVTLRSLAGSSPGPVPDTHLKTTKE
jgi:ferredoxin--NADP+ reductase